jgi:hypothetical protein
VREYLRVVLCARTNADHAIRQDVDVANLRTAATLLRGLSFEEDKSTVEKNDSLAVKYFTYFSKLLARCKKEVRHSLLIHFALFRSRDH